MKTYLTHQQALDRYPLAEDELKRLIDQGIDAVELVSNGDSELIFYDDALAAYVAERDITPEKFNHLRGNLLGMNEAGLKYGVIPANISRWAKQGRLEVKATEGQKKLIDEADIAYLVAWAEAKGMSQGKKVFNS